MKCCCENCGWAEDAIGSSIRCSYSNKIKFRDEFCMAWKQMTNEENKTDMIKIVRCLDCVKRGFDDCPVNGWMPNKADGDFFCADGERKERGEAE